MLKGQAKIDYQREYMRRKRAGLPTAKPKPEWQPTERMIDEIKWWAQHPWKAGATGRQVIAGLILDNDESWMEACQRYKAITDERRAKRKADKEREKKLDEERKILRCSFCDKPMTETGKIQWFGMGYERRDGTKVYDAIICEPCVTEAAEKFAKHKETEASPVDHHADD